MKKTIVELIANKVEDYNSALRQYERLKKEFEYAEHMLSVVSVRRNQPPAGSSETTTPELTGPTKQKIWHLTKFNGFSVE